MNPLLTYRPKSPGTNIGGYRYFFNGQEGDNEVFGENSLFAFEYRMHDARLGRFWSVDPLADKYPWNSTYAFCENTPIWARELEGLEAKIVIAGSGGSGTHYSQSDINAFNARALMMQKKGFSKASVHNGQMLLSAFREVTKRDGSILSIITYAHGGAIGIFLDNDEGFYTTNWSMSTGKYADMNMLANEVKKYNVKFEENATWVFASCYAANSEDGRLSQSNESIAENAATTLNITTIGSTGPVFPEIVNGKETGRLKTDGTFKKFEPYTVTKTTVVKEIHSFLFIKWTKYKQVQTDEIKVKITDLGKTIDPSNP